MNKPWKLISIIILSVLIIISLHKVSSFLQRKESDERYSAYFAEENQIDVLFIGASHVRHGFFPMELWNDYGISSYNLAANSNTIPVSYWMLVNALDYQTPEVIIMDVYDTYPGNVCGVWEQVHDAFGAFPITANKFRMVQDLFTDKEVTDIKGNKIYEKRWELLWDFGEYHTRWNAIERGDFMSQSELEDYASVWKGSSPLIGVAERDKKEYIESVDDLEYDWLSKEYLERIIALCRKQEIALVLINTGYDCSDEARLFADSVYEMSEQYRIPYLDFTKEDIINFDSDLNTSGDNTHVNFSGAEKFTKYIGTYLTENYQLEDHRNDDAYISWWEDYQKFTDSKEEYLIAQDNLINYLMLLSDDDYQILVEIWDSTILYENGSEKMFKNLGLDYDCMDEDCNMLVIDNENRKVSYLHNNYKSGSITESVAGKLTLFCSENSDYEIILNDKKIYKGEINENGERIKIIVVNKKSGEIVDVHVFEDAAFAYGFE